MKRVKLKLAHEELRSLQGLCQWYTTKVEPVSERLKHGNQLGVTWAHNMATAILCQRLAMQLGKQLLKPMQPYYRLSIPPEYAVAILLAYWTIDAEYEPDILLESIFMNVHQQLA